MNIIFSEAYQSVTTSGSLQSEYFARNKNDD